MTEGIESVKGQRQPIRCFKVPFTASWRRQCVATDEIVQTRSGILKTGDTWCVELLINDRVMVAGFGTSESEAETHCWELLQSFAQPRLHDIRLAVEAVENELPWSGVECLALVVAFCRSESGPQTFAGLARKRKTGRGRPPDVDRTTDLITRMIQGWQWLTGFEIGFSEEGWLTRAIEAVAPYYRLKARSGHSYNDLRNALRSESSKYADGFAVWAPTSIPWPPSLVQVSADDG